MTISTAIKIATTTAGMKSSQLASSLGMSSSSLSNKHKRDSFTADDLVKIAEALGGRLVIIKDGTVFQEFNK